MGAFDQVKSGYTAVKFNTIGDAVAGRIIGFEDYPVMEYGTGKPKTFPSGDQIYGVHIHMETDPGNEDSRVTLWCEKANQLRAVVAAFREHGLLGIRIGDDLAMTFTGMDGKAKAFSAAYSPAEVEAAA